MLSSPCGFRKLGEAASLSLKAATSYVAIGYLVALGCANPPAPVLHVPRTPDEDAKLNRLVRETPPPSYAVEWKPNSEKVSVEDPEVGRCFGPPPQPPPHDCPELPTSSPLRALQMKGVLWGCPSDVQTRPGDYGNYEIAYTCPSSPGPILVVRGAGRTRFPSSTAPNGPYNQEVRELWKFADVTGAYGTYYGTQRGAESKPPPPPCANRPSGMVVEIDDYRKVDDMVERLIRWILHDNLDVEVILRFRLPPTQRFCYE